MAQTFIRSTRGAGALDRPGTTHRQDLVTVLLATWLIVGIGLDGWAHSNLERQLESFFTPWHAVFYSGFAATALWVLWMVQTRHADHVTWTQAVPLGYGLGVVGVAAFTVGGVGDLLWHPVFGIETGIAALLSPTHLLLFTGVALILLAPFRAAWSSPGPPSTGLLDLLPAFLSITLLTALVAFFFQYSSLFSIQLAFSSSEPVRFPQGQAPQVVGGFDAWAEDIQIKGIMAALFTSLILVAPVLLMLRRWRLPFGATTILFLMVAAIIVALDDFQAWENLVSAAAAGVAADGAIARLRPSPDRVGAFRAIGSLIPMAVIGCTFLAAVWRFQLGWPAELWTGTLVFGGLAGYALPSSCSRRRSRASTELIDGATADSPLDHFEQAARLAVRLVMQSLWRRRSASSWAGTATSGCAGAGRLSHTSRPGGSLPTRAMTRPRSSSDSCRADPSGAGRRVVDAALVEPVQPAVDHDRMAAELGRALASELGGTVPTAGDDAGALEPAGRGMPGVGELAQGAFPAGSAGGQAYSDGVTIRSLRARAGTYFTRGSSNYNGI